MLGFKKIDLEEEFQILNIQKNSFFKKIDLYLEYIDNFSDERKELSISFSSNYVSLNHIRKTLIASKKYFNEHTFDKENNNYKKITHIFNMLPKINEYLLQLDFMDSILSQISQKEINEIHTRLRVSHRDVTTYHYNLSYPVFEPFTNYNSKFYFIVYQLVGFDIFSNAYLKFKIKNSLLKEIFDNSPDFYSILKEKESMNNMIKDF